MMHLLFLSCLKATELIEKKLRFKLSLSERIRLAMHKSMCDACSNYQKQSEFLDDALMHSLKELKHDSETLKRKIKVQLSKDKH